jgi:hypothetical protein
MDFKVNKAWGRGLDLSGSGYGPVDSYEERNEMSASIKGKKYSVYFDDYKGFSRRSLLLLFLHMFCLDV